MRHMSGNGGWSKRVLCVVLMLLLLPCNPGAVDAKGKKAKDPTPSTSAIGTAMPSIAEALSDDTISVGAKDDSLGEATVTCKKSVKVGVYKKASASSKKIAKLKKGAVVSVLEDGDKWYLVRTDKGKTGYVRKKFLTPDEELSRYLKVKGDGSEHILCELTPLKDVYSSGETIRFRLDASFASPSAEKPVTIYIKLPKTVPALSLENFDFEGPKYPGVPAYRVRVSSSDFTYIYWFTDPAEGMPDGHLEFSLEQGDTISTTLKMSLPNGITEPIEAFTLEPKFDPDYTPISSDSLKSGTTALKAAFGWEDVVKTGSPDNIGKVSEIGSDATLKYNITSSSLSLPLKTGAIFTKSYTLTDTISLSGMYFDFDATGEVSKAEPTEGGTLFKIGETKILSVNLPKEEVKLAKVMSDGKLTGLTLSYEVKNQTLDTKAPKELEKLSVEAELYIGTLTSLNAPGQTLSVRNEATLDAYSLFYDAPDKTGAEYHHRSKDSHTAYTRDGQSIEKKAYSDAECREPADRFVEENGDLYYEIIAQNNGAAGTFDIRDEMGVGISFVSASPPAVTNGKTITWKGVNIDAGGSFKAVVQARVTAEKTGVFELNNRADLMKGDDVLDSAAVQNIRYTGVDTSADIDFKKTINNSSPSLNNPITYTVIARNDTNSAKEITIVDNWPGGIVDLTGIRGCEYYELVMADGSVIDDLAKMNSGVIDKIRLYNIVVGASSSANVYLDGTIKAQFTQLTNTIVGSTPGQNDVEAYAYCAKIGKEAYLFKEGEILKNRLTQATPVTAPCVICYELKVENNSNDAIADAYVIDDLPEFVDPVSVTYGGSDSDVFLRRSDGTVTPLTYTIVGDKLTSDPFTLVSGETADVLIFVNITQEVISRYGKERSYKFTNKAKLGLSPTIQTLEATADVYTFNTKEPTFRMFKSVSFVANFEKENGVLKYRGRNTKDFTKLDPTISHEVWEGAYVCFQIGVMNYVETAVPDLNMYELVDVLPSGLEFVGLSLLAENNSYSSVVLADGGKNLPLSDFITAGEDGIWENGTGHNRRQKIHCAYDEGSKTLSVTFIGEDNADIPLQIKYGHNPSSERTYFYVLARVTDVNAFSRNSDALKNTAKAKIDAGVKYVDVKPETIEGDADHIYVVADRQLLPVDLVPGIEKDVAPADEDTKISDLKPEDPLVWTIRVKNENGKNIESSLPSYGSPDYPRSRTARSAYLTDFKVVDYLPAQFAYVPGSAKIVLNQTYVIGGEESEIPEDKRRHTIGTRNGAAAEPTVTVLDDKRKMLTWTFSGLSDRLYNYTNTGSETVDKVNNFLSEYMNKGFMHIITYETQWDTKYDPEFGTYVNEAVVKHTRSFKEVSAGTADYGKREISAVASVDMYGNAATSAQKSVSFDGKTATGGKGDALVEADRIGDKVRYTLRVTNREGTLQRLVLIDRLPEKADTGVVASGIERESDFSVTLPTDPNVEVRLLDGDGKLKKTLSLSSGDYTVDYAKTASHGQLNDGDWMINSATQASAGWGSGAQDKNALRIGFTFDDSLRIASGEMIEVSFDAIVGDDALPKAVAWNSFGYMYSAAEGVYRKAEPAKVGVRVAYATLRVSKKVVGEIDEPQDFYFIIMKDNTVIANLPYTVNGQMRKTGENGVFALKADETAIFDVLENTAYMVGELDPEGGYTLVSIARDGTPQADITGGYSEPVTLQRDVQTEIVFTNARTQIQLTAKKTLTGKALEPGMFAFELLDAQGRRQTKKNNWKGEVTFDKLTYAQAGTYTYTVREAIPNPAEAGMTYDESVYAVTVTVEMIGGVLCADSSIVRTAGKNGQSIAPPAQVTDIVFENTYKAPAPTPTPTTPPVPPVSPTPTPTPTPAPTPTQAPGPDSCSWQPEAFKKLIGKKLKAGQFEFVVQENGATVCSATNSANGDVIFPEIWYTQEGSHTYEISEIAYASSRYVYDTRRFTAIVIVKRDEEGNLKANVLYPEGAPKFKNKYKRGGSLPLTGEDTTPITAAALLGLCLASLLAVRARMARKAKKRR